MTMLQRQEPAAQCSGKNLRADSTDEPETTLEPGPKPSKLAVLAQRLWDEGVDGDAACRPEALGCFSGAN